RKRIPVVALAAIGIIYAASPAGAAAAGATPRSLETALFAGGCFWSMEYAFEKVYGVVDAVSGYAGGTADGPTYYDYEAGGHAEAVQVIYDPSRLSFAELVEVYWRNTDPADGGGQFVDRGPGYRPIIFADSDERRKEAEASKAKIAALGVIRAPIATEIRGAADFWPAESYHQDYARREKASYDMYRQGSGRPTVLSRYWGVSALADPTAPPAKYGAIWKIPSDAELRKKLTPLQYEVTQRDGTEPAYANEYWDEHRSGSTST
ncbi:MAG: peptide-methionine (S)-S-oxide reductase MsrA, partial [Spirochaetaceae bacterium]|nr:peptide-methionine (S)-S-oxide reductase MsrA [Spirochaetaceae bacterium]